MGFLDGEHGDVAAVGAGAVGLELGYYDADEVGVVVECLAACQQGAV